MIKTFLISTALALVSLSLSGCAPSTNSSPSAPTATASARFNQEENEPGRVETHSSISDLKMKLSFIGAATNWLVSDFKEYFDPDSGYLGALSQQEDCNVATFPNAQKAFNTRLKLEDYNYLAITGSFKEFGLVVFSHNYMADCARRFQKVATFLDEGFTGTGELPWSSTLPAIEDCWLRHLDCLTSKKLVVPWTSIDEFQFRSDALGELVRNGYCVTTSGSPMGLSSPGYLVCSAKNGKNIYASTGSQFIIKQVASTSKEFSNEIIAGDGWILKFDAGFSSTELDEIQRLSGGSRIVR